MARWWGRRAPRHPDPDRARALRESFVANRDRVRAWVAGWDFPEVAWPDVRPVPSPWVVTDEPEWFEWHAPYMDQYWWLLEPAPLSPGIVGVDCGLWFRAGHEFDRLTINTVTAADPPYLAEQLTRGIASAALRGWEAGDAEAVRAWLLHLIGERPFDVAVRQTRRTGRVLVEVVRWPHSRGGFAVQLVATETDTALDGSPLDESGRAR